MEPLLSEPSETRFRPTAPLTNLRRRAALYRELRSFFDEKGFVEVSTPALSRDVVVDRFVESIPVVVPRCWQERDDLASRRFDDPETSRRMVETFYLQTSPEFAMKRLVASGMDAIYQLAPAFRRGDCGKTHNVEFTMLEWYRTGDDYSAGRRFLADLVENVARAFYARTDVSPQSWSSRPLVMRPFGDVFVEETGIDPHICSIDDLRRFAQRNRIAYPESYSSPENPATRAFCSMTIRRRSRSLRASTSSKDGPSRVALNCLFKGLNSPTATTNCSIRRFCAIESPSWRKNAAATVLPNFPENLVFLRRWTRDCRLVPVALSASIACSASFWERIESRTSSRFPSKLPDLSPCSF